MTRKTTGMVRLQAALLACGLAVCTYIGYFPQSAPAFEPTPEVTKASLEAPVEPGPVNDRFQIYPYVTEPLVPESGQVLALNGWWDPDERKHYQKDYRTVGQVILALPVSNAAASRFVVNSPATPLPGQLLLFPQPTEAQAATVVMSPSTLDDAPLGFTGRSRIVPREVQQDNQFIPIEDRWRIGFPQWDRYGKGHPVGDDYPFVQGRWWDPYNQNVLKGDYPILGQNIFLEITGTTQAFFEPRQTPTATTPFESTANPDSKDFFGRPGAVVLYAELFLIARFVPRRRRVSPRRLARQGNAGRSMSITSPSTNSPSSAPMSPRGRHARRTFCDAARMVHRKQARRLGPELRLRLHPRRLAAVHQRFSRLHLQRHSIAACACSATISPIAISSTSSTSTSRKKTRTAGSIRFAIATSKSSSPTTIGRISYSPATPRKLSFHYNHDSPTFKFDNNGFLVRPDPVGVFQPHTRRRCVPRLDRRRPYRSPQHHPRFLLGARPRHAEPARQSARRASTPRWRRSNCRTISDWLRFRVSVLLVVRRSRHQQ